MNMQAHLTKEAAQAMTPAEYAELREAYYEASSALQRMADLAHLVGAVDRDNIRQLNAVFNRLGALGENL